MTCYLLVPMLLLAAPPPSSEAPAQRNVKKLHFIEASGSGATTEDALKDAFREAVRRAVGAYVDEQTQVKDDEVITDQVLTHSRGCIDSYEKLSETSEDGVFHVIIRAVVKPDEVVNCLRKANVAMTELSGEQFWAKVSSLRQEEKDAESLLRKALVGFPENCLKAEPVGEPRQDHNETLTRLGIKVRISVDQKAFQTFSKELQRVLEQISKTKTKQETETTFQSYPKSELPVLQLSSDKVFIHALLGVDHKPTPTRSSSSKKKPISAGAKKSSSAPNQSTPPKYSFDADVGEDIVVALNTRATNSGAKLTWKRYLLDKSLRPLLMEVASRKLSCRLMLVDSAGSEVAAQTIPSSAKKLGDIENYPVSLLHSYSYHDTSGAKGTKRKTRGTTPEINVLLVSQVFFSPEARPEELPELRYDRVFDLTDAQLRSVKQTLCKLSRQDVEDTSTHHYGKKIGSK